MENLVPKPGATRSPVCSYFAFLAGADGKPANEEKPVCRECGRTVATKGSNTSNMLSHLRNSHPTIYSRIKGNVGGTAGTKRSLPSTSGTQQQTLAGSFAYARNSRKWEQLTGLVTFCLAKDVMPIYSVEKPGFRELLKAFDPQYELPSRKYFSNSAIPSLYTQTVKKWKDTYRLPSRILLRTLLSGGKTMLHHTQPYPSSVKSIYALVRLVHHLSACSAQLGMW